MNCQQVKKYIGAFADGELDVKQNLEVLEHVNICPECAQRAEEVAQLQRALRRIWEQETAPPELHARVRAALSSEALINTTGDNVTSTVAHPAATTMRRPFDVLVPLTLAASLVAAMAVWQFWPVPHSQIGQATVVYARAAADVRAQHGLCVTRHGPDHHDNSLSRELPVIARRLGERLGLRVIAPDLESFGYELIGADRCGIKGRPGSHILYRPPQGGDMLSVFTVQRMAEMIPDGLTRIAGRDYYVNADAEPTLVAWHESGETQVFCANLAPPRLLQIAGDVRTASAFREPGTSVQLASWTTGFAPK